jgi:hypothetical protein
MPKRLYDDQYEQDETPSRGLLWWLFCMPGAVLMWVEYMFPKHGQVYASGRRYGNRLIQFLYTIGFYVVVAIIVIALVKHQNGPLPGQ